MKALAFVLMAPGLVALMAGLFIFGAFNSAWPLTYLWLWFVVPFGAPALSVPQAMGVLIVVQLLRGVRPTPKRENQNATTDLIAMFTLPWVALACGWIVKAVWL